jgi:hypothetical protein
MLGGGKDTILWKVCREGLKMSYQQDAFVLPTEAGWEFRIAVATDARILKEDAVSQLVSSLAQAVDGLSETDLQHARGLLKGFFEYGQSGIPIKLGQTAMTTGDDNETLFRDLYLNYKRSAPFSSKTWISGVSLIEAKTQLKAILESASISFK